MGVKQKNYIILDLYTFVMVDYFFKYFIFEDIMRKFIIIISAALFMLTGCREEKVNVMAVPIQAEDFYDLQNKINIVCAQINSTVCSYIKGPISVYLPDATSQGYILSGEEAVIAENLYKRLNGKTPEQIIAEYKKILKNKLDEDMERDRNVTKMLNNIEKTFKNTKEYAKDVIIKDINTNIGGDNIIQLAFTIENRTPFNILQFSGETEFFTSDTFLARSKAFSKKIEPYIPTGSSARVNIIISSIEDNDITLIRAAKDLTTKVIITSLHTDSQDNATSAIVLSLPYSYFHLRQMIEERESIYNATLKKIDNIY